MDRDRDMDMVDDQPPLFPPDSAIPASQRLLIVQRACWTQFAWYVQVECNLLFLSCILFFTSLSRSNNALKANNCL